MKSMTRPIPMLIWGLILFCIVGICLALGRASGANVELGPSVQFSEEELRGAIDEATLLAEANRWELRHGGISGRTAQQFINYLAGKEPPDHDHPG